MRQASTRVSVGAQQIAAGSDALAVGASEQAASLEEVSASLQESRGITQRNADDSRTATELMKEARAAAETGTQAMARLSDAVHRIQDSASCANTACTVGLKVKPPRVMGSDTAPSSAANPERAKYAVCVPRTS